MYLYRPSKQPPLITRIQGDCFCRTHQHEQAELCYVLSGSVQYTVNSTQYLLKKGSLILIFPYCLHSLTTLEATAELLLFSLELTFVPDFEKRFCEYTMPSIVYQPKELSAATTHALTWLSSCSTDSKDLPLSKAKGWLTVVLGDLFYKHPLQPRKEKLDIPQIRRLSAYMCEHLSDISDTDTLCRELGISRHYLTHTLKQQIYVNHTAFLTLLRLERADELLCNSSLRLIDIALECGFGTVQTFTRNYKKAAGITPAAVRELCDHTHIV